MVKTIIKRDGRTAEFHPEKIADAVEKSFQACAAMQGRDTAEKIAATVVEKLESGAIEGTPTVEGVQDLVEETLIESGFVQTAKAYILYRAERSRVRDVNSRLIQTLKDITFSKAADSDMKRENANIDADTAMGTMLKYGSESAKQFYEMCVIDPRYAKAHREGDIHIHDMDFYTLTTTCCQIELRKLFKGGFSTGHGVLREPNDISSYAALACIAIQSNQNDQHGGQSVCDFDYGLAVGVGKTYRRLFKKHVAEAVKLQARVDKIADGAALMTETSYTRKFIDGTADCLPNRTLETLMHENFAALGVPQYTPEELDFAKKLAATYSSNQAVPGTGSRMQADYARKIRALQQTSGHAMNDFLLPYFTGEAFRAGSTDVGDVSWLCPTAQCSVASIPNGCPGHSWQIVSCGTTSIAHKAALHAGRVIACTAIDLFAQPERLAQAKAEFDQAAEGGYVCPIPPDAVPVVAD